MDQDKVAAFVADWERERPDLDAEPMLVISRIQYLAGLLEDVLAGTFRKAGLSVGEYDVLSALRRAGMPFALAPGEIVTRTLVTPGAVTKRVDRLVSAGLVERTISPADGRRRVVRLTDRGLTLVDRLVEETLAEQRDLLRDLGRGEVAVLSGLLQRVDTRAEEVATRGARARDASG